MSLVMQLEESVPSLCSSTPVKNVDANAVPTQGSGTLFSGLINQKRNSGDAAAQARRESFNEQKPQAGFLGKMWNKYVYSNVERLY
jgi:hypothetical protein